MISESEERALRLAAQINRLSQLLGRPYVRDHAAQVGLSLTEWRVFVRIVQDPGTTVTRVSAATGLIAMTVSRSVAALREKDLVTGAPDPADSRRMLLRATPSGRACFDRFAPSAAQSIGAIMGALSDDEESRFAEMLERLIALADEL
ncbi:MULTISPECIES: MarR family winged helix-turn-helix transcriptional regulator [unclassified Microbacterium]|uniref:MarR family winged helix-turn-helix transcriptional regulator n=1 Tax=unclassified Microbacterium TaxID=2609290 RepID=UPI00214CF434|nr:MULTISPECIES: MarR family winged helix-turn-helix transcriptional regulator [unclassified Microbacterium]MCR2808416.1 MarR family winged helix-turn-helix transcriptional regulator [Microbacterium sp. zg.B185]WIM19139.1 MarR family winged helix-turn-helix transcriptional regulator [Microbacterium sp. zg-B185]